MRAHFGLTQDELAAGLGTTRGQVAHVEAGRRRLAPLLNLRLVRLARRLPPPDGVGPPAFRAAFALPAAPVALFDSGSLPAWGPLAADPLRRRQRHCIQRLALLHRDWHALTDRATRHDQRRWTTQVLGALLAPDPADPLAATDPAEQAHLRQWLAALAAAVPPAPALRPDTRTALALLAVRIAALEAEAAALAVLLADASAAA